MGRYQAGVTEHPYEEGGGTGDITLGATEGGCGCWIPTGEEFDERHINPAWSGVRHMGEEGREYTLRGIDDGLERGKSMAVFSTCHTFSSLQTTVDPP